MQTGRCDPFLLGTPRSFFSHWFTHTSSRRLHPLSWVSAFHSSRCLSGFRSLIGLAGKRSKLGMRAALGGGGRAAGGILYVELPSDVLHLAAGRPPGAYQF